MALPKKKTGSGVHPIFISISVIILGLLALLVNSWVKNGKLPSLKTSLGQSNTYKYDLAEFSQKQQTFSPYTKYVPAVEIDKSRNKLYFVFKVMDDNNVWQAWTGVSDLDGNNWKETQQTKSAEGIERISEIYSPKNDLLYYFYRTSSKLLMMATKSPNERREALMATSSGASSRRTP